MSNFSARIAGIRLQAIMMAFFRLNLIAIVLITFLVGVLSKASECPALVEQVRQISGDFVDPVLALDWLMYWEETSNVKELTKPTVAHDLKVVKTNLDDAIIRDLNHAGSITSLIVNGNTVFWPKHPWNADTKVPYFNASAATTWKVRFSASRSLFLTTPTGDLYSIKLPTDNAHGKKEYELASKADLTKSVIISLRRSKLISTIKQWATATDSHFEVLLDVMSVADRQTGNGFVIRDLRPLQDGHYYLPAFSVPYAGREIAKLLGQSYTSLWGTYYGALLGRAKASLLLNYGLQMKTPNAQNMLIQLDKNLRPTGKMFFRDISDSSLVQPVAEAIGLSAAVAMDKADNYFVYTELVPNWKNSTFYMNHGGLKSELLDYWGKKHNRAYIDYIISSLGKTSSGKNLFAGVKDILSLQKILFSEKGKKAMAEYAQRQIQEDAFDPEAYCPDNPNFLNFIRKKFLPGPSQAQVNSLRLKFLSSPIGGR